MFKTIFITLGVVALGFFVLVVTNAVEVSLPISQEKDTSGAKQDQSEPNEVLPVMVDSTVKNNTTVKVPILPNPNPALQVSPKTQTRNLAFALLSASNPESAKQAQTLLENKNIDGVALQIGWASLETGDEVFNWATLDAILKIAKEKNKGVTLHIFSGAPTGRPFSPWLKSAGVKTYTVNDFKGRSREEALPWDVTLLSQYSQFLKSLSVHLKGTDYLDTVARISVAVPVAEMDLIACRSNMLANAYPYDRATYLASWKAMIDAHATAFPELKKFVSMPVGLICFPERDTTFFTDLMNYATQKYGKTFVPFAADLTSTGSDRSKAYTDTIKNLGVGYQPIWSSTSDPSNRMKGTFPDNFLQAVCTATKSGADYVEVYSVDVLNTDATIQKGIQAVHDNTLCP
ncbi:MAG: hypothetical protein Q7K40_03935 [bacterium]|nr:hypothetical protein [bacterium]